MGLRARRTTSEQSTAGGAAVAEKPEATVNTQVEETPVQTNTAATPPQQQQTASTPAVQNNAVATSGGNAMADMNAGILDNIDDMNIGGNYVTMDGSVFLYKAADETAESIEAQIVYGKRYYQWYDEENQRYNDSDTKLDDRYKLKFEIRWMEDVEGEMQEHTMSLPTASAMNFINYVKGLTKQGLGVGQVITKFTISRQQNKDQGIRYSRTEFENLGVPQ